MANKKIGCSAGKTSLVDPNNFDGQNSSTNISVPLEDLSITVQLETTKKARTLLTSTGSKNFNVSSEGAKVTFIEGSGDDGKKKLTTSYTDLTTSFDESGSDSEALGITSIDIEFNSSNAPLIVINFVDLRGSAIYQNEEYISNSKNKYAIFFQLPYPLFKLTVKGYYGLPVEYELHMTKYNSKFNSKTGNFEITANFIGYTYAMLSDMLIGYLKAIPYTKLGEKKYSELKKTNNALLTLDELLLAISEIDSVGQKLKETDQGIGDLNRANTKRGEQIDAIKLVLFVFGQKTDVNDDLTEYKYVVPKPNVDFNKVIEYYNTYIFEKIRIFNENPINNITFKESDFKFSNVGKYVNLNINMLNPFSADTQTLSNAFVGLEKSEIENTRSELFEYAKKNGITSNFNVIDFRKQYAKISEIEAKLDVEIKTLQKNAGETLRLKVQELLGFSPTVRNIISIFTSSVEAFMSVLFDVSKSTVNSLPRENELKKFGPNTDNPNAYDIKPIALDSNGQQSNLQPSYYPWPEYRKEDAKQGLIETYLGEAGVLRNPSNVEELAFIDDLLNAFLISKTKSEEAEIIENQSQNNWLPTNPVDTRLFIDKFPYSRINGNSRDDVISLALIRAMTYLGYTNYKLTTEEIEAMANAEGDAIRSEIKNDIVVQSLSQLSPFEILNTTAINDNSEYQIVKYLSEEDGGVVGDSYYYNYIFAPNSNASSLVDSKTKHLIPISVPDSGKLNYDFKFLSTKDNADGGEIFLTNFVNSTANPKTDDGGIYVKFFTPKDFNASVKTIPTTSLDNILNLDSLKKSQSSFNQDFSDAGFNQFGGSYGIQEFKTLNFGTAGLEEGEFRIMFFDNANSDDNVYVKSTVLSSKRITNSSTIYDIKPDSYRLIEQTFGQPIPNTISLIPLFSPDSAIDNGISVTSGSDKTRERLGENRELLSEFLKDKSGNVTIPFINFQVAVDTDDSNFSIGSDDDSAPVGLFGSRLYNEQESEYSKALLFLHTLPWNGLLNKDQKGIFDVNEILNTFGNRGGFISCPKLWISFIGALLWRADTKPVDEGGSGPQDPILWSSGTQSFIPTYSVGDSLPTRTQYITSNNDGDYQSAPMMFPSARFYTLNTGYKNLENVLLGLPEQVKNEFKRVFFDFVKLDNGVQSDWDLLSSYLEVYNGTPSNWVTTWNEIMSPAAVGGALFSTVNFGVSLTTNFNTNVVKSKLTATHNGKLTFDDYIIFSPYYGESQFDYNFVTELKDSSKGSSFLLELLSEEVFISNSTYKIWRNLELFSTKTDGIYVSSNDLTTYFTTLINKLKPIDSGINSRNKQRKQEIFGTDNDNIIKLQIYRTCKNIYDKWIGGTDSFENIILSKNRSDVDIALALKGGRNAVSLIDTFRFVNRSLKDIGDDLYINPLPVADALKNNPEASFYNVVTNLLSINNFNFTPLPTFINYKDTETLETLFEPMSSIDGFKAGSIGPSFVCVYIGQPSKYLDFKDSEYLDDGIQFRCDEFGNLQNTLAKDFTNDAEDHEDKVAVFAVNYSQQNQNIFKDITLDQNEFTETDESLKITDEIASKGAENRKTYGGQNIYDVYSVRSYKAEVEMMGNSMIQPMMYFQLNNIPMFHGAYMVIKVKHSIKPNYMSTVFTGVRIRNIETPILDASDLYMSMLDSIEASTTLNDGTNNGTNRGDGGGRGLSNYIDDYYNILLDVKKRVDSLAKDYVNTNNLIIDGSTIPNVQKLIDTANQEVINWKNGTLKEADGTQYLDVYAKATPGPSAADYGSNKQPWSAVFISYLMSAGDANFPKNAMHYYYVTAAMNGVNGYEAFPMFNGLKIKAEVGDILCKKRTGSYQSSHCDMIYKVANNIAYIIGGNISDTIFLKEVQLSDGYIVDSTDLNGYKILVKKTDNKYYQRRQLTKTNIYPETSGEVTDVVNDGALGYPVKYIGPFPTETQKINALGQI